MILLTLTVVLVMTSGQQPAGHGASAELNAVYEALAAGEPEAAIKLAERYAAANPRNPAAFLAVGDAYAARAVVGRFSALKAYRHSRELAPKDPEPSYRMVLLAFQLRGADGERIAREELERILELDPMYKDALAHRAAGGARRVARRLLGQTWRMRGRR